jgi:hypothetical protein
METLLTVHDLIENLKSFPPEYHVVIKNGKYDAEAILTKFDRQTDFYVDLNGKAELVIETR